MIRRGLNKLLIEPPTVATGDIAFNLVVFFLVCASTTPDTGRRQDLPKSDKQEQKEKSENIEVALTRTSATINGSPVKAAKFLEEIGKLLKGRPLEKDRVVVVKSSKDTPYQQWITYTELIERAGGVITLELEEEQTVVR